MSHSGGPDTGYAWIIAIAACVITMILSGISKMVGMLYVAVIETYGTTRQAATLPFTFRKALRCLAGPIVGIFGQRYGIRAVTLGGGVVAALGAALCFIAPNIIWLTVCWGGVHGLGEAFANTLFQVVVDQYFVNHRATASGIAMSGACIGSVGFSFLIEALREAYGLQGTFLILSGVILNVLPAAILLRPPIWTKTGNKSPRKSLKESIQEKPRMYVVPDDYVKSNAEKKMNTISCNPNMLEKIKIFCSSFLALKTHSTINLVDSIEMKLETKTGCDNFAFAQEERQNTEKQPLEKQWSIQNVFATSKEILCDKAPSMYDFKESPLNNKVNEIPKKIAKETQKKSNSIENIEAKKSLFDTMKNMGRLCKNPMYVLICFCMCTYVLTYMPIMTSAIDYSNDKGLPESIGKFIIHAMALGDFVGRLCFGWVTDRNFISIPRYMTLTLVLDGIFIILLPFTYSIGGFLILLGLFSMTAGSMLIRMPLLVLKHVNKDQQAIAMGSYSFVAGFMPFIIPLIIGHFRDHIGSYNGMYFMIGGVSIVSGGLWLLEPALV